MFENTLICKICGGDVKADAEGSGDICLNCGNEFMRSSADTKKLNRITYFRNNLNFAAAEKLSDEIILANPEDSEAHWNKFLSEYGIQYVLKGGKRFPVCRKNPSSLAPLAENESYKRALYYATEDLQSKYSDMGVAINEAVDIARNVFAQEKSYDIFVLTAEDANADEDSYGYRLFLRFTENLGFSVFYAPEILKDMDESEKAAHIAYALENSRIMLPSFKNVADCCDGFNNYAVNAFAAAIKGEDKYIFPVFSGDTLSFQQLPETLVWLDGGFDSTDSEFMREISETVEKILKPEEASVVPDAIVTATAANKENLIKRAYMFLEDGEFETADTYFDKILDIDIEESRAYIGKLLAKCKLKSEEEIPNLPQTLTEDKDYIKAIRFATPEQKARYEALNGAIVERIEGEKKRISEERQRIAAERAEAERLESERRARQHKEERKLEYKRRRDPLKRTLDEVRAELNKTFITPKRKAELKEDEAKVEKNLRELDMLFADIFD
ncbi:MAG: hypothetical protein J6B08_03345 [Ruminiclostridium sp.]|nr:hypothetical protein [Ruminiclostridium sp.]